MLRCRFDAETAAEMSAEVGEVVYITDESRVDEVVEVARDGDGAARGLVPADYLARSELCEVLASFEPRDAAVEMSVSAGAEVWLLPVQATNGWCQAQLRDGCAAASSRATSSNERAAATRRTPTPTARRRRRQTRRRGGGGGGRDEAEDAGAAAEEERVQSWLREVTMLLAQAEAGGTTLEAEALADFDAEAEVELPLRTGERLALLQGEGVAPPAGWQIALKKDAAGGRPRRGLVPATFVQLLPFDAVCARDHAHAATGSLALTSGQRVRVLPAKSTEECWWAQLGSGGDGSEGLVSKAHLTPLSADELRAQLQAEAEELEREEAARREAEEAARKRREEGRGARRRKAKREAAEAKAAEAEAAEARVEAEEGGARGGGGGEGGGGGRGEARGGGGGSSRRGGARRWRRRCGGSEERAARNAREKARGGGGGGGEVEVMRGGEGGGGGGRAARGEEEARRRAARRKSA